MNGTTSPNSNAAAVDSRADYIAGLRQLADLLEQHEQLPIPYQGSGMAMSFNFWGEDARERVAEAARLLPCRLDKNDPTAGDYDHTYFTLRGRLHGLSINVRSYRNAVCERIVTGTTTVTEEVHDPEALATVPKVTVTREVEQVEWRCHPLLAEVPA